MNLTKLDTRFFESTRGQIVMLLRMTSRTVNEISDRLKLTDNAIRAHLLTLERDGLVEQKGAVKGFRKPHYAYGLTDEARHLFPKPYAFVLNKLMGVLKRTRSGKSVEQTLRSVGHELAGDHLSEGTDLDSRLDEALKTIELLGGAATVVRENGSITIRSESCPFHEVVSEHPEACQIAESMIEEIVGAKVREVCDRTVSPNCRFRIDPT